METQTLVRTPVLIEARSVYGRTNYYVVSEHAQFVNALTGKKTIELRDVRALEALGFVCMSAGRASMPACELMCA